MKKILACFLSLVIFLGGCTAEKQIEKDETKEEESYQNYAQSGVWISYSEINSMLKSERGFQSEFHEVLENCKSLKINEIYVHIRAFCDSLFESEYFPLTEAAKDLDFDAFEYIVEQAHLSDIKVHAWINPYRVRTASDKTEDLPKESPAYIWLTDQDKVNDINVLKCGGIYLNPAEDEARRLVINGVREVIQKYDIDGIHFDDYFYPTTEASFDAESYKKYTHSTDLPLTLEDWRRANVDSLIAGTYNAVKTLDEDIIFSVSPAADIGRNYNNLYADIGCWVREGIIDAIIPQLYFGFEYPDENFTFENLIKRWKDLTEINDKVKLIIGLAPYKIGTDSPPDKAEWTTNETILARQVKICKEDSRILGYIFFSYSSLFSDETLNLKQRENLENYLN